MDEYLAIIKMFGGNFAPRGFMLCQGQVLSIATNTALFSLLGTTYGGNGQTTFGLPDLRGRVPKGAGNGPGLTPVNPGDVSGVENVTILLTQMPSHTHVATFTPSGGGGGGGSITATLNASNKQATQSVPGTAGANTLAAPFDTGNSASIAGYVSDAAPTIPLVGLTVTGGGSSGGGGTVTVGLSGGNQPMSIVNPYLGMNYIICTEGLFPSRN
ncbi:MAG: tail fiber protein [Sphingobacteriaceae bacterium]|nr:tail fiber protein [Sphingobacteriaceae bacterium]